MNKQPMQPIEWDKHNVVRFKANALVEYLLEHGGLDMNALAHVPASDDDFAQFAQLIGYSVSGFGELSYVTDKQRYTSDKIAVELTKQKECLWCNGTGRQVNEVDGERQRSEHE